MKRYPSNTFYDQIQSQDKLFIKILININEKCNGIHGIMIKQQNINKHLLLSLCTPFSLFNFLNLYTDRYKLHFTDEEEANSEIRFWSCIVTLTFPFTILLISRLISPLS